MQQERENRSQTGPRLDPSLGFYSLYYLGQFLLNPISFEVFNKFIYETGKNNTCFIAMLGEVKMIGHEKHAHTPDTQ